MMRKAAMMSRSSRRLETIMRGMLDREVLGGAEVRSPVTGAAAADGRRAASQEQCARRRSIASDVSGAFARVSGALAHWACRRQRLILPGWPVMAAIAAVSVAGSTGFGACTWNPAASARA